MERHPTHIEYEKVETKAKKKWKRSTMDRAGKRVYIYAVSKAK